MSAIKVDEIWLKDNLRRLNHVANLCRSQNEDPRLSSALAEMDSTLMDMRADIFGMDEIELETKK